ncbi:MAG: sigma-70 family RNA polymerase sigma factor [Woeseiaceae bacterium]
MTTEVKRPSPPGEADFHQAISMCSGRWYSACLNITRDPELAADAVQDALLSAWDKRRQFGHGARLDTWIHRIAVNAALQLVRKRRAMATERLEQNVADDGPPPDRQHAATAFDRGLAGALARLTEIERLCFVLRHMEQWRIHEIAAELGINVGSVKQAVFRAVRKLRVTYANLRSQKA